MDTSLIVEVEEEWWPASWTPPPISPWDSIRPHLPPPTLPFLNSTHAASVSDVRRGPFFLHVVEDLLRRENPLQVIQASAILFLRKGNGNGSTNNYGTIFTGTYHLLLLLKNIFTIIESFDDYCTTIPSTTNLHCIIRNSLLSTLPFQRQVDKQLWNLVWRRT